MEPGNKSPNPFYSVTNYLFFFGFLIALCIIDFNIVQFFYLQFKRLGLAIETFFFRIRLEWDIFFMRFNKRKYLKMAQEILKDIEQSKE